MISAGIVHSVSHWIDVILSQSSDVSAVASSTNRVANTFLKVDQSAAKRSEVAT